MKKLWIPVLMAGILMLGGCSYLGQERQESPVAGPEVVPVQPEETTTGEESGPQPVSPEDTTIEPLTVPDAATETNTVNPEIVIATDIHYLAKELTDFSNAFSDMERSGDGKLVSYVWEITDAFLEEVVERRPQALVLTGDLSLEGEKLSHEALAHKLEQVEDAGIPVVVIPGNHDINNPRAASYSGGGRIPAQSVNPEQFAEIYEDFGYGEAVSRDPSSLSYVYELSDGTWSLLLDTCQYEGENKVGGMVGTDTYHWIDEQMEIAWNEERQVIAAGHHNLLDESRVYEENCTIEHAEELERKLEEWGIGLYLSGHLHVQHYKTSEEHDIDEIVTSSLSTSPCQYGILRYFVSNNYSYTTKTVDVSAWAERKRNPDVNLQDFVVYSDEFLQKVFYNHAKKELEGKALSKEDKESMSELYALVNVYAVSGRAHEIRDLVMEDPSFELWQEYSRSSILCMYMNEILEDAVCDYNKKSRP